MAPRECGVAVARERHLALLGHLEPAVDRARRLRLDRARGRAAAPPERAASPVEDRELDAAVAGPRRHRALRGVQREVGGEHAHLLRGVGVPDHHLEPARRCARAGRAPRASTRRRPGSSVARASSAPDSNRHTTSSRRGSVGDGAAGERVGGGDVGGAAGEAHDQPVAGLLAQLATGCRRSRGTWRRPPGRARARRARSTSACCRTSIDARWKPNVSTCRRGWSSPPARRRRRPRERARRTSRSRRKRRGPYARASLRRVVAASRSAISTSLRRCGASGSVRASSRARAGNVRTSRASDRRSASGGRHVRSRRPRATARSGAPRPRSPAARGRARSPPRRASPPPSRRVAVAIAADPGAPTERTSMRRWRARPSAAS